MVFWMPLEPPKPFKAIQKPATNHSKPNCKFLKNVGGISEYVWPLVPWEGNPRNPRAHGRGTLWSPRARKEPLEPNDPRDGNPSAHGNGRGTLGSARAKGRITWEGNPKRAQRPRMWETKTDKLSSGRQIKTGKTICPLTGD
jgi:hypothetical protein